MPFLSVHRMESVLRNPTIKRVRSFCLHLSPSVSICLRLSPSVSVCLHLSLSVHHHLSLSPSSILCIVYAEKKLPSWKKIGLFRPYFPPKGSEKSEVGSCCRPCVCQKKFRGNSKKISDLKLPTSDPPPPQHYKITCFSNECSAHTMAKVADRS